MSTMTIGERIRDTRIAAKMTQESLARAAGIALLTAGEIERGNQQPMAETVVRIARALGCTTDYLLGMDEEAAS